jgi:hypothetical protein
LQVPYNKKLSKVLASCFLRLVHKSRELFRLANMDEKISQTLGQRASGTLTQQTITAKQSNIPVGEHCQRQNKLRGLNPRANYTDRRLSTKLVPSFADRGCRVVSATDPYRGILGFLDRSSYFFFQVAPKPYSRG